METADGFEPNLLLSLNLSDSEPDEAAAPSTTAAAKTTTEHQPTRAERTALSEEAFQLLKQTYRPKIENGNIYKTIQLPTSPSSSPSGGIPPLSKPEAQALLHATEELYFFRRYAEAAAFLQEVLAATATAVTAAADGEEKAERMIDSETMWLLQYYQRRCLARLSSDEERRKESPQSEEEIGVI